MTRTARRLLPLAVVTVLWGCGPPAPTGDVNTPLATLVVTGGRVWTGEPERPWADAVAVNGNEIIAVGSRGEVDALAGRDTRVLDAHGGLVVPGFIDSHVHFLWGGDGLASVQLRDAGSPEEFTRRIAEFAATLPAGEWVLNGAWDHENWGGELPSRGWINAASLERPVWITRLDGHMALANSVALELAGVTADTPDPEGGTIVRNADGTPTGILKDNAMALVARVAPPPSPEQQDRMVDAATEHLASHGVTSVHDMGDWNALEAYRRAHAQGRLKTRIYAFTPLAEWQRLADAVAAAGRGDEWLRIGGLKGFMDGSLGSHTAAFFEPYSDTPEDRGLLVNDPADVERWVREAAAHDLHVAVHAIGDRANSLLLDIFERVSADLAAAEPRRGDPRFRIEHAQHLATADIARFASLGVIPSMQPYHAIDDGRWADKVIGAERAKTTYAFASLAAVGAAPSFGSDWPVAPPDPLAGIHAAVTRATLDGAHPHGWVPEQKVSVEQALTAYTRDAARAGLVEDRLGSLAPGKLADLAVLDSDITRRPPEHIRDARVLHTVVDGRLIYSAPRP